MKKYSLVIVSMLLLISCTPQAQSPNSTPYISPSVSPSDATTDASPSVNSKPISQSQAQSGAKLTDDQISQINSLQNFVVLPTYIPAGFEVADFGIDTNRSRYYGILYRNPSTSACFQLQGGWWPRGSGPSNFVTRKVLTPAFGEVTLEYTESDQASDSFIRFEGGGSTEEARIKENGKDFTLTFSSNGPKMAALFVGLVDQKISCQTMKLEEAIKVVESLSRVQ